MFPHTGKNPFTTSSDAAVTELQKAHAQVEDIVLGMLGVHSSVKLLAHFDKTLEARGGQMGTGTGAIRYWDGKFSGSNGVLIENGGTNLITNPSAEVDLTGWSASDPSIALTRDTATKYGGNGVVSAASFKLAGSSKAGLEYVKSTLAVITSTPYSASVYVYSATAAKARLELSFSGGTPVSYDSGEVTLTAGQWQRIGVAGVNSNNNTSCEIRVYAVPQAPTYLAGSRLSKLIPTATALISDAAMTITAGDIVMCSVTANPTGPDSYAWHMVSTGATGVNSSSLRLDEATAAPTYTPGTRFSKMAPAVGGDTALDTDVAMTITAGDFVFCNILGQGYGWHVVTTGATGVSSNALRLDDMPSAPALVSGSRLTRFTADASALSNDAAMTLNAGDMVFCCTLSNPARPTYRWHLVTTGATGVNSAALRLDNASAAPVFPNGSRLSKRNPAGTGVDTDMGLAMSAGDFVLAYTTKNPTTADYQFHMVTTAATGVANAALRIDQATSDTVFADAIQMEVGALPSGYIDSYQGSGFTGTLGTTTSRSTSKLSYPTTGMSASAGTVAFYLSSLWAGNDSKPHVLFDMGVSANQDRILFTKDSANKLTVSVFDTNGGFKQVATNSTVSFAAQTWQHLAFTYFSGTLKIYLNGLEQATSSSGTGTGQLTNLPSTMYVGTDLNGSVISGAVFDDLVALSIEAPMDLIERIASDNGPFLGLAASFKGFAAGQGFAITHATPGTQIAVSHGLGVTPSFVLVTERTNGIVYLSADADATNFYVKGSAASVEFDWRAML